MSGRGKRQELVVGLGFRLRQDGRHDSLTATIACYNMVARLLVALEVEDERKDAARR